MAYVKKQKPDRLEKLNALKVYTLTELESIIGVSHVTLLNYVKQGRIKAVKIGNKWRVTEENLKKFLNGE